jgi:predicted nucleic acid-binding protein
MIATCLLDSGIIIDVLNGKRGRGEFVDQLIDDGAEMACCSINVTEVYAGMRQGEEAKTERLLRSLRYYAVTWEIAKQAGDLHNAWRQQGCTLSLPDVTIAAVALANDLTLVTGNVKDFPMHDLRILPLP